MKSHKLRHTGLEPGSRFLVPRRTAGPRLRAGVTIGMASHRGLKRRPGSARNASGRRPVTRPAAISNAPIKARRLPHKPPRHPGLEPGSRFLMRWRRAGPRLKAGVTIGMAFHRGLKRRPGSARNGPPPSGRRPVTKATAIGNAPIKARRHPHKPLRHPGLEPGSRFLLRWRTAGPRLKAGVTG